MLKIDVKRVNTLIRHFKKRIATHQSNIRSELSAIRPSITDPLLRRYLTVLVRNEAKLITASLRTLKELKDELDLILILDARNNPGHKDFKDRILNALEYNQKRSDFYPDYFQKLEVKACVYCNSQLCVTAEDVAGRSMAKFQVDHHLSKSIYPGFSICLVNLVPACFSCNNIKNNNEIDFEFYGTTRQMGPSKYSFELVDLAKTRASYLSKRDPDVIKIQFNEPPVPTGKRSLNGLFAIEGIYNTQRDIVEELILKAHIYDNTMKQDLMKNFGSLFNGDREELERLIVSNYINEKDMHNRPMSKFTQDIARQLGLIK